MNSKQQLGQFYTKDFSLVSDFIKLIQSKRVIGPFAGAGDLLYQEGVEGYDIGPKNDRVIRRDTLMNPLDYTDCAIVSNPPYLAKNKSVDKTVFNKYGVDDLYKASIESILSSSEGVLILPINFFSTERGEDTRKKFLSKFRVEKVVVHEQRVFEDTDYCVCAFYYCKVEGAIEKQEIEFTFLPSGDKRTLNLRVENNFFLGLKPTDFERSDYVIGRARDGHSNAFVSNIKIYAIDGCDYRRR